MFFSSDHFFVPLNLSFITRSALKIHLLTTRRDLLSICIQSPLNLPLRPFNVEEFFKYLSFSLLNLELGKPECEAEHWPTRHTS